MQDPISDMLTIIRNGFSAGKKNVLINLSKQKRLIANLLLKEGYISSFNFKRDPHDMLKIYLKYHNGSSVIELLQRVSRPGLRIYKSSKNLPRVRGGFGIAMVSTSRGLMSDRDARGYGIGGEIVGYVA
jgi:small subunit ribosomal protein S8